MRFPAGPAESLLMKKWHDNTVTVVDVKHALHTTEHDMGFHILEQNCLNVAWVYIVRELS